MQKCPILFFSKLYKLYPKGVHDLTLVLIYTLKGLFLSKYVDNIPEKVYNTIVILYLCAKEISK